MTALSSCSGMSSSTLPAAALVGQAVRVCTGTPPAWKDGAVVVAGEGVWHAVLEDGAVLALAWGPLCAALTAAASHAAAGRQSKPAAPAPHAAPLPQPAAPRPAPAPAAAVATAPKRKYKGVSLQSTGMWRAERFINGVSEGLGLFARAEDAAAAFDASVRASGGQVVNFPQPGTAEVEAVFGESAENTLRKKRRADGDAWAPPARRAPAAVSRGTSHALPGGGGFLARAASAPSPSLFLPPALRPPAAAVSSHGAQAAAHAAARGVREGHGGGGGASRGTAAQAPLPPPRKARSSSPPETAPLLSAVAAALAGGLGATNGPTGGPTGAMSGGGTHAAFSALGSIHLSQRSAAAAGNNAGVGTGVGVPTTSAPSGCALPFSDAAVAAEQRRGFTSAERSAPNQHAAAYAAHPASLVRLAVPTLSSGAAATQTQGAAAGDANSPGAAASNAATHPFSTSAAAAAPPRPTSAEWEFTLKAVPTIPHSAAATLRGAGPSGGVATSASGSALVSPPSVGALCGSGDGSMQRQMSSAGAAPMRASPPRPAPAAPLAACDITPEAFFLCGLRPPIADAAAVLAAMMSGSLRLAHLQAAAADSFGDRQQPPHDADPVPPPPRSAAWRDLLARLRVTDAGDAATLLKAVLASQSNIATHMVCE